MARIQSSMYSCSVLVFVLMICGVDAFDALVSHFSVLCLLSSLPSDLLSTVLLVLLFVELLVIEPPFVGSFRLYRNLIILFCFAFFSPLQITIFRLRQMFECHLKQFTVTIHVNDYVITSRQCANDLFNISKMFTVSAIVLLRHDLGRLNCYLSH